MESQTLTQKQAFHNTHETFTERAYADETLLPDRYVLVLTNLCNLRCEFCFQKKDVRPDAMTTEQWLSFCEQLPPYARVTFTGGEPLMFRGFREVFSTVTAKHQTNIISNGLLLNEDVIDFILSYPNFKVLSLSIDDIGDTIRGVKSHQWEKLLKSLEYFRKKRDEINPECILDIKTVVLDENAHDLLKIHQYFLDVVKADTHVFQFLKGSPIQHADYMFDYDDIFKKSHAHVYKNYDVILQQLELSRQYNLKNNKAGFVHPNILNLNSSDPFPDTHYLNTEKYDKSLFLPCKFPWSSVHINMDGILFPCLAIDMGNVKTMSLKEIIHGEKFMKFKKLIRKEGSVEACNRCGWLRPKSALA